MNQVFGHFLLHEKLGEGAFAVVWRATDTRLGREVALKLLHAQSDAATRQRFDQEMRAVARLSHDHIITLLDAGSVEETPYLVFQLVDGVTLREWQQFVEKDPRDIAVRVALVADAIAYAHENEIVHRDLKPENIIVDLAGKPYVADFGLALIVNKRISIDISRIGTVAYLAPEQASHDKVDGRADLYSLGVILFESLTGDLPFRAKTQAEYLAQLTSCDAPSISQFDQTIHRDLAAICSRCLQRNPSERYASAIELAEDLRRFSCGQPTHARPLTAMQSLGRRVVGNLSLVVGSLIVCLSLALVGVNFWFANQKIRAHKRKQFASWVQELPTRTGNDIQRLVQQYPGNIEMADSISIVEGQLQSASPAERMVYLYVLSQYRDLNDAEVETVVRKLPARLVKFAPIILELTQSFSAEQVTRYVVPKLYRHGSDNARYPDDAIAWSIIGLFSRQSELAEKLVQIDENQRDRFLFIQTLGRCELSPKAWLDCLETTPDQLRAAILLAAAESMANNAATSTEFNEYVKHVLAQQTCTVAMRTSALFAATSLGIQAADQGVPQRGSSGDWYVHPCGITFVKIEPGEIELPTSRFRKSLKVENPFYASTIEIPRRLVKSMIQAKPQLEEDLTRASLGFSELPFDDAVAAHMVDVRAAMRICNELSRMEQRDLYYRREDFDDPSRVPFDGNRLGYRIPSRTEWEWMSRGNAQASFFHGGDTQEKQGSTESTALDPLRFGWFADGPKRFDSHFRPGAKALPNGFSLFDVYGNVGELALDRDAKKYDGRGGAIYLSWRQCDSESFNNINKANAIAAGLRPVRNVNLERD